MKLHEIKVLNEVDRFSREYKYHQKEYHDAMLMAQSTESTGDKKSAEMYRARAADHLKKLKKLDEGWKEGAVYTVLIGLLSLGAISRLGDLVNATVTGEPTKVLANRLNGINRINAVKATAGDVIKSVRPLADGKKFKMTLSDGRAITFTVSDLETAKRIAKARRASEPEEVSEGSSEPLDQSDFDLFDGDN